MSFRVGQGWDRHRLVAGRRCVLGGVEFPDCPAGPLGHSDGDAVLHAVADALLGAAGLGDIGGMFPDTDPRFEGADSLELLRRVVQRIGAAGFRPVNADLTVICEEPKIGPLADAMREKLAGALGVDPGAVGIKATRGEGLGPEGRGECITVQAVVLLEGS